MTTHRQSYMQMVTFILFSEQWVVVRSVKCL